MKFFTETICKEGEADLAALTAIRQLLRIINDQFEELPGLTRFSMLRDYLQEYQYEESLVGLLSH